MKRSLLFIILLSLVVAASAEEILSPSGRLKVLFQIVDSAPSYSVWYDGKPVVAQSKLGFEFAAPYVPITEYDPKKKNEKKSKTAYDQMSSGFTVREAVYQQIDDVWAPVLGERETIRDKYNAMIITLDQPAKERYLKIEFRAYDQGIAFRYVFERQRNLAFFEVENELTQFVMTGNHTAFWQPGAFDSELYAYQRTKLSQIDATKCTSPDEITSKIWDKKGVQTPILMKAGKVYISIFEAALKNYPALQLQLEKNNKTFSAALAPSITGAKAFLQTPFSSPWRTIMVSDNAADMMCNNMILNLNEPCKIGITEWIRPLKCVGLSWEMYVPERATRCYSNEVNIDIDNIDWKTMIANHRHGATTSRAKQYIDFAAKNGFDAVLIEGWNVGWEDASVQWKERNFDFVTSYPDFDLTEVNSYAQARGVKIILQHQTAGSVSNYERSMPAAFRLLRQLRSNAIKTGYAGRIVPRGELHSGQMMVNHYNYLLNYAAENEIMVDAHEAIRPTGICRTYPNLIASESALTNRHNTSAVATTPEHETILPFTRMLGGAIDYSSGIFELRMDHYRSGNPYAIQSTLARQLALYVVLYSPMQMAADIIENYEQHSDAFQFIKDVETDWLDTKVLEAEPGEYVTIARQGKKSKNWFVGAITNTKKRKAEIDFSFLDPERKYVATVYADAPEADYSTNPAAYTVTKYQVTSKTKAKLQLASGGGIAISIEPVTNDEAKKYRRL